MRAAIRLQRIEPQMASAIRAALAEHDGSLLAFLPGVAEIERTAEALGNLPANVVLHRLHGGDRAGAAARRARCRQSPARASWCWPAPIAETSLTLDDVRIVVDSGLARRPRYDRGAGLTRLVTERASRAAVTQRAGRAARQAPGIAIRLWEEAATASLPAHDPPEILEADLVEPAADLPAVGRERPEPPALPRPAARARPGRGAAAAGAARRDRCGRPHHAARPGDRRHPARAAPGAYADRGAGARVRQGRGRRCRTADRARAGRQ